MGSAKRKHHNETQLAAATAECLQARRRAGPHYAIEPGDALDQPTSARLNAWLAQIPTIAAACAWPACVGEAYAMLLAFIWLGDCKGACHSSSAALHLVLCEHGLAPRLCFGEVNGPGLYFDHSWITLDGRIIDAAISLPLSTTLPIGAPVFASVNLDSGAPTPLAYGPNSGRQPDATVLHTVALPLHEYRHTQPPEQSIWSLASALLSLTGKPVSPEALDRKYGQLTRDRLLP